MLFPVAFAITEAINPPLNGAVVAPIAGVTTGAALFAAAPSFLADSRVLLDAFAFLATFSCTAHTSPGCCRLDLESAPGSDCDPSLGSSGHVLAAEAFAR